MQAQQQKLDAVANDLANANTNGYKRQRVGFSDLLYEQGGRPTTSDDAQLGTGARIVQDGRYLRAGQPARTPAIRTDVGIEGEGFIKVKLSDGREALTRDGDLHVDDKGRLVTSFGGSSSPGSRSRNGSSRVQISIGQDGTVTGRGPERRQASRSSTSARRRTSSPSATTPSSPPRARATRSPRRPRRVLKQGALEASNTDMAQAMTDMIEAQRTYQLTSKAIQTADQMMEIANGVKR